MQEVSCASHSRDPQRQKQQLQKIKEELWRASEPYTATGAGLGHLDEATWLPQVQRPREAPLDTGASSNLLEGFYLDDEGVVRPKGDEPPCNASMLCTRWRLHTAPFCYTVTTISCSFDASPSPSNHCIGLSCRHHHVID